jgi:integrase
MKRIAKKAKITKRVHPHAFRHSHASQLAAEGVPINVISMQLGHSGSAITSRYIDHINPTEVIEVARNREWKIQD